VSNHCNSAFDVVEIGERQRKIGEVLKVKPLGALAMISAFVFIIRT